MSKDQYVERARISDILKCLYFKMSDIKLVEEKQGMDKSEKTPQPTIKKSDTQKEPNKETPYAFIQKPTRRVDLRWVFGFLFSLDCLM